MAEIKLKPCPFCGSSAHVEKQGFPEENTSSFIFRNYRVVCDVCLSQTGGFYVNERLAIKAWNRRYRNE